jgi:hypothetical protein
MRSEVSGIALSFVEKVKKLIGRVNSKLRARMPLLIHFGTPQ